MNKKKKDSLTERTNKKYSGIHFNKLLDIVNTTILRQRTQNYNQPKMEREEVEMENNNANRYTLHSWNDRGYRQGGNHVITFLNKLKTMNFNESMFLSNQVRSLQIFRIKKNPKYPDMKSLLKIWDFVRDYGYFVGCLIWNFTWIYMRIRLEINLIFIAQFFLSLFIYKMIWPNDMNGWMLYMKEKIPRMILP